jgi:DNA mismatch repair protein MutS2
MWLKQNAVAAILEAPDSSNKVLVGVGNLRARVPLSELRALKSAPQSRPVSLPKTAPSSARRGPEIDLRGLRVEEALVEVDKFLDDALLAGWSEIRLIHGKGTGALRKSIADYLKGHSAIRNFRAAPLGEGDAGVTIVELS